MPHNYNSIRTIVKCVTLALAFVTGVACGDLDAALDKEECFGDDDCGSLNCVAPNPNGLNPNGLGWCLDGSTCIRGEQPYCPCEFDSITMEPVCTSSGESDRMAQGPVACWDKMDPATCLCLPSQLTCQYDPP